MNTGAQPSNLQSVREHKAYRSILTCLKPSTVVAAGWGPLLPILNGFISGSMPGKHPTAPQNIPMREYTLIASRE